MAFQMAENTAQLVQWVVWGTHDGVGQWRRANGGISLVKELDLMGRAIENHSQCLRLGVT